MMEYRETTELTSMWRTAAITLQASILALMILTIALFVKRTDGPSAVYWVSSHALVVLFIVCMWAADHGASPFWLLFLWISMFPILHMAVRVYVKRRSLQMLVSSPSPPSPN